LSRFLILSLIARFNQINASSYLLERTRRRKAKKAVSADGLVFLIAILAVSSNLFAQNEGRKTFDAGKHPKGKALGVDFTVDLPARFEAEESEAPTSLQFFCR
jgi:hypothetical protein